VAYGEIKRVEDSITIKEKDLQKHLKNELKKVDGVWLMERIKKIKSY